MEQESGTAAKIRKLAWEAAEVVLPGALAGFCGALGGAALAAVYCLASQG